jgi:CHRD domain-containing protein
VRKLVLLLLAGTVAALAVTAYAGAARNANPIMIAAKLTAKEEVPAQAVKNAKASGSFTGDITGHKLTWTLKFSGLTGPATAAHIHLGGMGVSGNVVVPLCGPCKSSLHGTATLSAALLKDLKVHKLYVNVHTAKNPAGEIRGQLAQG